jgi:antibiotic biosynthesis monooxygenase (ABM) superfamily enzyme
MNDYDMKTRPRWQSLLIAFSVIFGLVLLPVLFINRWLEMPIWGIVLFSSIGAFLIVNKFFARTIL